MDNLRERFARGRLVYGQDRSLEKRGNTGVALSSMNQRAKFYYEGSYGTKVYSAADIGTTVEIIPPAAVNAKGGES